MKKITLILCVLLVLTVVSFSKSLLGLRTVEATETSVSTPVETTVNKPALRTVNPLLHSFRNGWSLSGDYEWEKAKLGTLEFSIPKSFKIQYEKSGLNYDSEIKDANGRRFAQLFVYQLESYDLESLFGDLMGSLYGGSPTNNKEFEEFKDLGNDKTVYFTNLIVENEKIPFSIVFFYTKDGENTKVKSGTVIMLICEPTEYQREDDRDKVNAWIEGMGASVADAFAPLKTYDLIKDEDDGMQEPGTLPDGENVSGDNDLGAILSRRLVSGYVLDKLPKGWKEAAGRSFKVYLPEAWVAQYFNADTLEGFDFGYDQMNMAKLFIGYAAEEYDADEVFKEFYDTYLSGLGEYEPVLETSFQDPRVGSMKVYESDFDQYKSWVVLYSESGKEGVISGSYIAFIGIAPFKESEAWKDIYADLLMSVQF